MYRDFHIGQNNALHTDALSNDDDDILQIPSQKLSMQFGTWINRVRSQFILPDFVSLLQNDFYLREKDTFIIFPNGWSSPKFSESICLDVEAELRGCRGCHM